jgi:hypothetical protein
VEHLTIDGEPATLSLDVDEENRTIVGVSVRAHVESLRSGPRRFDSAGSARST